MSIIELAKACPDAIISVRLADLLEANEALIERAKAQLEEHIADQRTEAYLSRQKVAEVLDVDLSTLHRWAQRKVLVPLTIGGKRKYKRSDVMRLLEHPELARKHTIKKPI